MNIELINEVSSMTISNYIPSNILDTITIHELGIPFLLINHCEGMTNGFEH